ncbi:hypothetical protein GQ53DRAFT_748267 [Thozetella sp. PMI_491]|nr:hypothetical protein GQ53DRAFT_748267 [Thozetella sp. PMI_491]
MHIKPAGQVPPVPARPQIHSAKHHHTYSGAKYLPVAVWVMSPTIRTTITAEHTLVYEVRLYYKRNRACTIYRSWDDFKYLRLGVPYRESLSEDDADGLHNFLWHAISKHGTSCAVEYFLRRRMEDCSGF